jgi:hexulose-6-phosphate isomerase
MVAISAPIIEKKIVVTAVMTATGPLGIAPPCAAHRSGDKIVAMAASRAASLGAMHIVIPLVDNGRLDNAEQSHALHGLLIQRHATLQAQNVHIAFESDLAPNALRDFLEDFPDDRFGINYDIGNSASLGYDPEQEMQAYASRVTNVHVKDRKLGGTTVPLGTGAAKMKEVLQGLSDARYAGNFILQTARAADGDHVGTLARYLAWTLGHLEQHFES